MGDRGPILRVRRLLIREGVATRETPIDELDERAAHLILAVARIDAEVRGALCADGRGRDITPGRLIRRLAAVADAATEEGT